MLVNSATFNLCEGWSMPFPQKRQHQVAFRGLRASTRWPETIRSVAAASAIALVLSAACLGAANAIEPQEAETLSNIPQTLSGECQQQDCKKTSRIQRPKSRKAETCTIKCVTTCIRAGSGSPGEGPFNVRRPLVVFKQGFRSRHYCLVECSDICNLIGEGDDGP